MMQDADQAGFQGAQPRKHLVADQRMLFHGRPVLIGERAGLAENAVLDSDLADVMQQGCASKSPLILRVKLCRVGYFLADPRHPGGMAEVVGGAGLALTRE